MLHLSSLKNIAKNNPPGPRKWKVQTSNVQFMQITLYKTEVPLFRGVNLSDFLEEKTMGDQTPRAHDSPSQGTPIQLHPRTELSPAFTDFTERTCTRINFNQFIGVLLVQQNAFIICIHLSFIRCNLHNLLRSPFRCSSPRHCCHWWPSLLWPLGSGETPMYDVMQIPRLRNMRHCNAIRYIYIYIDISCNLMESGVYNSTWAQHNTSR